MSEAAFSVGDLVYFTDWDGDDKLGKVKAVLDDSVELWDDNSFGRMWSNTRVLPIERVRR